jgi:hypothetical protein
MPRVATGIKAGVATEPRGVWKLPRRGPLGEQESLSVNWKFKGEEQGTGGRKRFQHRDSSVQE